MNIETFIKESSKFKGIPSLMSSAHSELARKILNEILVESPIFADSLYVLSRLSLLIWAKNMRNLYHEKLIWGYSLGFTQTENRFFEYGVKAADEITAYIKTMNKTHRAVLEAVHLGGKPESLFIMKRHYKEAVASLCQDIGSQITDICKNLLADYNALNSEEVLAFHDLEFLLALNRDYLSGYDYAGNIDSHTMLLDAAEIVKMYNGCILQYGCLKRFVNGDTETAIANALGKSRTYVRARLMEGETILSVLLWGLSDKDSLVWIGEKYR